MSIKNIISGKLTIQINVDRPSEITIECESSGVEFVKVLVSAESLMAALGRLGSTDCILETKGLDKVGKTQEYKDFEFLLGEEVSGSWRDKEIAREKALELCPEGWKPDLYFNSQTSFFTKDGKGWARTMIRRYI